MRKRKSTILYSLFFVLLLSLVLLSGCGSAGKDGAVTAFPAEAGNVGDTACVQCHSAVADPLTGESIIAQYQNTSPHMDSEHANDGNGCEACHGGGSLHFGSGPIAYPDPFKNDGERCASCHKGKHPTNAPAKFADSKHGQVMIEEGAACRRCHTHEGAVLGGAYGFTGDEEVLDDPAYQGAVPLQKEFSQFECGTCHEHGGGLRQVKARDEYGNIITWNPSGSNYANDQFNLCTSCHTMFDYTGDKLLASGTGPEATTGKPDTGLTGHHGSSWYRVIATTHYDNPDTGLTGVDTEKPLGNLIEGYNIRIEGENPCFDCHGHEAKTNTNEVANASIDEADKPYTIHTEWAKSGHAGGLLKAKIAAANYWPNHRERRNIEGTYAVDSALVSGVSETNLETSPTPTLRRVESNGQAWVHYNWDKTQKDDGSNDRGACQKCHTATGASNYLTDPANYDPNDNDFSHLEGWKIKTGSPQQELLYCWGCHSNSGVGTLRNPGAITADYKYNGAKAQFPDVDASNVCLTCHSGRESGESITSKPTASFNNLSFVNSHYMAAGGLMYVKIGFTAFTAPTTTIGSTTKTYGETLTSTEDGGALSSTHRHFGSSEMIGNHGVTASDTQFLSGGPCVTCHLSKSTETGAQRHHTLEIDEHAINNVCLTCHDSELGTTLTDANFESDFLEPQSEIFQDALTLAVTVLKNNYNISYDPGAHPYFFDDNLAPGSAVKDWTRGGALTGDEPMKLMGACFNINVLTRDPAAYAHARTYARRLLYDSIDFLDDNLMNLSSGQTAQDTLPAIYTKGTKAFTGSQSDPGTTLDVGTSEAMTYLLGWSRTSGSWSSPERP